jgi:hypothetical protein
VCLWLALQQVKQEQAAAQLDDELDDTLLIEKTEKSSTLKNELLSQLTGLERYAFKYRFLILNY